MPVPEAMQSCVKIYAGQVAPGVQHVTVNVNVDASVAEVIEAALDKLNIPAGTEHFDLVEVYSETGLFQKEPELCGDARILNYSECPSHVSSNWYSHQNGYHESNKEKITTHSNRATHNSNNSHAGSSENLLDSSTGEFRFYLRQKRENLLREGSMRVTWLDGLGKTQTAEDWHFEPTFREHSEIDDLTDLPVLNEQILLKQLLDRFCRGRIYTYVGGILVAINPFKFLPIYNPKYVKAYQHRRLGELPPHVFAMADAAYNRMLKDKENQCIVISGESGSGKTESTKLILHHLTALSHKTKATVLEKTILAAGPVLEVGSFVDVLISSE